MGVVYKAKDTKLKRTVALKFLPPELTHIPEVKDRFMREAQSAAGLDHPNICTVYEADEFEAKPYIAMAYIKGQSLRERLKKGPLDVEESLDIAVQVAEGLKAAHKSGIIHRDIKSANIMVTDDGQAKIMDFGLAKVTGSTIITKEGKTMGTVAYMSPEQSQGHAVDQRTDIWSFGIVLYEMLTGQLPFNGEHEQSMIFSILNNEPEQICGLRAEISSDIEKVVYTALAKNPDDRYQQIEDLSVDLKSIASGLEPEKARAKPRKKKLSTQKKALLYAGIAGIVVIMAIIGMNVFSVRGDVIEAIAVLPLENLSGDTDQEFFSDGVTDALINELNKISALRVISRTSVMKYKQVQMSIPEIARELNVDAIVEGSVITTGGRVQIRASLIKAPSEKNLWAESYEREISDILILQSELAQIIAQQIQIELTPEEKERLTTSRQVNPEAYEDYLKGLRNLDRRTPDGFKSARDFFQQAIDKDQDFAQAWAQLGLTYIYLGNYAVQAPSEVFPKAKAAALKALELDDTLAESHLAMTGVYWSIERNFPEAEKWLKQALEINPNYAAAVSIYGEYLSIRGRHDEAIMHAKKAWELDPLSLHTAFWVARTLYQARKYDEAIKQCENVLEMDPDYAQVFSQRGVAYLQMGMNEKAIEDLQKFVTDYGLAQGGILAYGLAVVGRAEEAKNMLDDLVNLSEQEYVSSGDIALVYMALGEIDKAFEWLDKAYEEYDSWMFHLHDPVWDPIRSDLRFKALRKKRGLD
jgi:serine/threonine protein kinase/Tfp pilus assembly protein PilF